MVRHSLRHHCFACARRPIEEDSSGRVDADLLVELGVGEWQLDGLLDLLLLLVEPSYVGVADIGFFSYMHHLY